MLSQYVKPMIIEAKSNAEEKHNNNESESSLETTDDASSDTNIDASVKEEEKEPDLKSYDVTITDGVVAKVLYEETDGKKEFKSVDPGQNDLSFDISPSSQSIVLLDKKSQKMVIENIDGSTVDISSGSYTSSSRKVFKRENILQSTPGYLWCGSPRFVDDTHVAYISQLPWFNKADIYYVWITDINSKSHHNINGLQGKSINFGLTSPEGIVVEIDGKSMTLSADGKVKY